MIIMTINMPKTLIKRMEPYIGIDKLVPSRSELIRVAIRDYLIKILELNRPKISSPPSPPPVLEDNQIQIHQPNGEVLVFQKVVK
jgi:hypothetical protein